MSKLSSICLLVLLAAACEGPDPMMTSPPLDVPSPAPLLISNDGATVELAGTYWNGCGPGEYVDVVGSINLRSQWKYDPATGAYRAKHHENFQGVSGVGQTSGRRYQVMQTYNTVDLWSPEPAYNADRHLKMRMTSQGPGDNSEFHLIYNIRFDPVTGWVFTLKKVTIECGG